MGRLKQKLKSEYGASILLALLFFLICGLVTAALLMSAVSNAGKIKNNEENHQKYLTVSSALQMVCEDLLSQPYVAKYSYTYTPETVDADGNLISREQHMYTQQPGEYGKGMGTYILDELDSLFAKQLKADVERFQNSGAGKNIEWSYNLVGGPANGNNTHTFEVGPTRTGGGDTEPVIIEMILDRTDRSYTINLTAKLMNDEAYAMKAELTPYDNKPMIEKEPTNSGNYEIELNWKLGWITKAE